MTSRRAPALGSEVEETEQETATERRGLVDRALRREGRSSGGAASWTWRRVLLLVVLGVLLLSAVRVLVDGADEITSPGTSGAALRLAVPIGLAALGGLVSERAGVINIALEGMLILGTWFGAYVGFQFGPWWGIAAGVLGGAAGGLLHAVATVVFAVDHIVSGVAVNLLVGAGGSGLVRYLSAVVYEDVPSAGPTQSPGVAQVTRVDMPFLAGGELAGWSSPDLLGDLHATGVPVAADVAGVLRGLVGGLSLFTLLAVALVPLTWFVLWRTAAGLRLRSCGESPTAAETLGVDVLRTKLVAVTLSGAFAGLGGAFLVVGSIYREGQVGGRGFIALAALIFGNWLPGGAAAGAGLFGYASALGLRSPPAVHALLLVLVVVLAALAVRAALSGRWRAALGEAVAAVVVLVYWSRSDAVPTQLSGLTPYVVTLLVLVVSAQRLRPPAADGLRWRRGQG